MEKVGQKYFCVFGFSKIYPPQQPSKLSFLTTKQTRFHEYLREFPKATAKTSTAYRYLCWLHTCRAICI